MFSFGPSLRRMSSLLSTAILASTALLASLPAVHAQDNNSTTLSGKVTEPNFQMRGFWIDANGTQTAVYLADNATITFNGQNANIYRMMGSPTATVTGTLTNNVMTATSVTITSEPQARLEKSSFTDQAVPPFREDQLAPTTPTPPTNIHPRSNTAGGSTSTHNRPHHNARNHNNGGANNNGDNGNNGNGNNGNGNNGNGNGNQ